jgi:tripartite-type tricarboxylate transporter receptor subunit TctC
VVAKLLMNDLGIPVQYIPFAGEAAAVKTLREGQLHAAIVAIQVALPDLRTGDIRGLAISDTERSPLAAQIPTFRELGYEHVQYLGWIALFAPPKTPERTVSTFNEAASAATRNFEFQDLIERIGFRPMYRGPLELRKILIQVITRITTSRELEAHIGPEGGGSTSRISCESIGNVYSTSKCSSNCTEICKLYGRGLKACNKGGAC